MKNDTIIYIDPILGIFTIQDLVNYLDSLILENQTDIDILDSILKSTEL